jgi:hypothetical protein
VPLVAAAVVASLIGFFIFANDDPRGTTQGATQPLPLSQPVITPCGSKDVADLTLPTRPLPKDPSHLLVDGHAADPGFFIYSFRIVAGDAVESGSAYLMVKNGSEAFGGTTEIQRYDLSSGALISSVIASIGQTPSSFAADEDGAVYIAGGANLHKFGADGRALWQRPLSGTGDAVYILTGERDSRVGVVTRGTNGSDVLDPDGNQVARNSVIGTTVQVDRSNGDLIATDGRFVRTYNADGTLRSMFGSALEPNDPGPYHFRGLGGATKARDGTIYLANAGEGLVSFTDDGLYRGVAGERSPLDNNPLVGLLHPTSAVDLYGDRIYYVTGGPAGPYSGGHQLRWMTPEDVEAVVGFPKGAVPRLGIGAGLALATQPSASYFPPGTNPAVTVNFEPWWSAHSSDITGQYTVTERSQVLNGKEIVPETFTIPAENSEPMAISLKLPPPEPGYYEVEAKLIQDGEVVSADCLYYAVGAAGSPVDLAALPAGNDGGGAFPRRDVALAEAFGVNLVRVTLHWDRLLPAGDTGPIDFSFYDDNLELKQAALDAAAKGLTFEVQLGENLNSTDGRLVENGTWGTRVREVVEHYKDVVSHWEVWNEPNLSWGAADDYTNRILKPAYQAIKAADPAATVIGGTVVGGTEQLGYWDAIGMAGGFDHLDVIGFHPYTGNNRSFEENGLSTYVEALRGLFDRYQAGDKPLWNTESSFASCMACPGLQYSAADKLVRGRVLHDQLGVSRWGYFYTEGVFESWALSTGELLKPAGLAALYHRQILGDRPFQEMLPTGVPHTYAGLYGPVQGSSDNVVVIWADDLTADVEVEVPGVSGPLAVTDIMGRTSTVPTTAGMASVTIGGSPQYLVIPGEAGPTITPAELFNHDQASASVGATAEATSAIPTNPPAKAIDGTSDAEGENFPSLPGLSAWSQAPADTEPALTITLPRSKDLNRVLVTGHSVAGIMPGLRNFDVELQGPAGAWNTVAQVRDAFLDRRHLVAFPTRPASAIRISVIDVNYGGYAGGIKPPFWPTDAAMLSNPEGPWFGPATIYEVEAFGPGDSSLPLFETSTGN